MRSTVVAVLTLSLTIGAAARAGELDCGTSAENDARVLALHHQPRDRTKIAAQAAQAPRLHDGAFYVEADDELVLGYRPFDLEGQSLVFEPRAGNRYAVRREPLRYLEPAGTPVHDFVTGARTFTRELGFTFSAFGRNVTRVHLTAFNGIHFDEPSGEPAVMQFDALEAAVHRQPLISPLMITNRKPSRLAFPQLFVEENDDGLVVTWRSSVGISFGYDVQAELRKDGSIIFSYRSMRAMTWGAPVLSAGFDPKNAARRTLHTGPDARGEVSSVPAAVRGMLDFVQADVERIGDTEVFAVRLKLAASPDASKIAANETLRYTVTVLGLQASVEVDRTGMRVLGFDGLAPIANGAAARVDGDVLEVYGLQAAPGQPMRTTIRVASYLRPSFTARDVFNFEATFDAAPRRVAVDLSSVAQDSELALPIAEPFVLGAFDPYAVWQELQPAFGLTDESVDAVAMYQTFFTDIIFYAGAYATGSNPQVDGIAPAAAWRGTGANRTATLLHMNQLNYGYQISEKTSSQVMLHEFGHRWLYFFRIKENSVTSSVLNPISAHPAGYVDTRSAFRVYDDQESSVMGGGFFTRQGDGSYIARAANAGYSWTDLYLMGLAAPEEVQPWFYLAGTSPALPQAYWPQDGIVVQGERRNVNIGQIIDVHGPRNPATATSQKDFRVAFVLVTEPGREATAAEIAKLNEWRALMERNFAIATGGRGRLTTTYVRAGKPRSVRNR